MRAKLAKMSAELALWLFWPALCVVIWGELTPHPPGFVAHIWDKALHFTAYFGLSALAAVRLDARRMLIWAVLGLIAMGGALEIFQGFTGRDADIFDEVANSLGALCGAAVGLLFLRLVAALERD